MIKYPELEARYNENISDEERFALDTIFECGNLKTYEQIAKICKEKGFTSVVDIGCAYGHQSVVFDYAGIEYVGIDLGMPPASFFNFSKHKYISGEYPLPFGIVTDGKTCAISNLCLTWNCYLWEGEKTLNEQMTALSRDFRNAILYIHESVDLSKWFDVIEEKKDGCLGKLVVLSSKGTINNNGGDIID